MTLWRLVLALIGLAFLGFGFAYIYRPDEMTSLTSIVLINATAHTDVRATYGGLEFGVGAFLLGCAFRRDLVRVGLMAAACVLAAMATARAVGLLLDGFWQPLMLFVTMIEGGSAVLATWGALVTGAETRTLVGETDTRVPPAAAGPTQSERP